MSTATFDTVIATGDITAQGQFHGDGSLLTGIGGGTTRTVEAKNSGGNIVVGDTGKVLTVNSGSTQTLNLPTLVSGDIGKFVTIVKLGAGQVTIQANTGQKIADSGTGDTIYNSTAAETYATLTLLVVTTTLWVVLGAHGTWVTTD